MSTGSFPNCTQKINSWLKLEQTYWKQYCTYFFISHEELTSAKVTQSGALDRVYIPMEVPDLAFFQADSTFSLLLLTWHTKTPEYMAWSDLEYRAELKSECMKDLALEQVWDQMNSWLMQSCNLIPAYPLNNWSLESSLKRDPWNQALTQPGNTPE